MRRGSNGTRFPKRKIGACQLRRNGETLDLHRWLVRSGWAIDFMPYSCERFKLDEAYARANRIGVWSGCLPCNGKGRVTMHHGLRDKESPRSGGKGWVKARQ